MWNLAPIELTSCLQRPLLPKKKLRIAQIVGPLAAEINIDIGKLMTREFQDSKACPSIPL
jgi:hypothetical protein